MKWLALLIPALAFGQFHRAEQDRDIRYWLLDPATHEFRISHDFTVTRPRAEIGTQLRAQGQQGVAGLQNVRSRYGRSACPRTSSAGRK